MDKMPECKTCFIRDYCHCLVMEHCPLGTMMRALEGLKAKEESNAKDSSD